MKALAVVVLAIGLAGCLNPRGTGEVFMSDAEIDAKDHGVCASFGVARGSPGYADCRLRLRSDRAQQDSNRRLAARLMAR
jgi:hypothetical protein